MAKNLENTKLRATKQIKIQLLFQDILQLLEMLLEGGKRLDRWFAGFRASDADKQWAHVTIWAMGDNEQEEGKIWAALRKNRWFFAPFGRRHKMLWDQEQDESSSAQRSPAGPA